MRLYRGGNPSNEEIWWDSIVLVEGSVPVDYFDGGMGSEDSLYAYEWEGTFEDSPSIKRSKPGTAIVWNGITGFSEGDAGASTIMYRDGAIYLADMDASDFSGQIKAIFFPDEFGECIGIPKVADGLYVDNQKPKRFSFSYRTLVGSGMKGDMFGYQIHLVYNCLATIGQRSRETLGKSNDPVEFQFDTVCTPVKLAGYRPSAHYIIDTRNMSPSTVAQLEGILYGTDTTIPRMPTPTELFDIMNFGDSITVIDHGNGTFTIEGADSNVFMTGPNTGQVNGINSVDNGDGTYSISDGGNTTITTG
jgi:hypothetical protein